jgi:DNA-binding NtrC family response regulator
VKILLVDDVREYLDSMARTLGPQYEVVKAASMEEAKLKADATISLALVDIRLSEHDSANRDGLLLLGWLKERFPAVPVVVMSAYRDFDAATDALNLGAARYLKKPINLKELRETITELLK